MKIGLDIDGVLADFIGAFRNEAGIVLKRQILGEPIDWEFSNWMTKEEQFKVWNRIHLIENWFEELNPMPGVVDTLANLTDKHEVYFVSTRTQTSGESIQLQTQWWLNKLGVVFPTVIITKNKGEVSRALDLDIFLDDKPENLMDIRHKSPHTEVYLQDASHNQDVTVGIRVLNFEEFLTHVS